MNADGLRRIVDPRLWPLAARVVGATVLLSGLAVFTVGAYLGSVISDGLFEQRQAQVLDESATIRQDLNTELRGTVDSTSTQTQEVAATFGRRDAALVPVDSSSPISTIASDRTVLDLVDSEFEDSVSGDPYALSYRSVARTADGGREVPGLLVGTRVVVPGAGSFDLYLVYSLQEEQETLDFVQKALLSGGAVLLALVLGIAVMVARLVTTPLRRAAGAAERIAAGDLGSRMEVEGADELAKVGRSFNDMAGNLEQKLDDLTELSRVQQRFVADVSHELRTPLTTIRMATGMLQENSEELPADLGRTVELLGTQVSRFDTLLSDLLEISRFDAGAAVLEAHELDLGTLVLETAENMRPLAGSRGVLLDVRLSSTATTAVMDPRRIDRVLRNLLSNAIEHGAGHPVVVRTGANDEAVAVIVQDHGHGLDPEEAAHVFDRFWRADPSRARTIGGTGLGLSISVEDAHLHGGWLQAWGRSGQGAVFRLTIPRRPGGHIRRSPLALERSFAHDGTEMAVDTLTGEIPIRPDSLPELEMDDGP
jgi:two-component system sensor histidine kinase MtrB